MITASKDEVGTFYPFTLKVGSKNIKNILESCIVSVKPTIVLYLVRLIP